MATFYKRGDGQWEVTVRRKGYPVERRTWGNRARGEEWARDTEVAMTNGTFQRTQKARSMLLGDLIKDYKDKVAPRLKDPDVGRLCDVLAGEFGTYGVLNLDSEAIAAFRDRLQVQGLGASTINHYLNKLSAIYTAAVKEFHYKVPLNPVKSVYRLTPPRPRTQRVPDDMIGWLVETNRASNAVRGSKGGRPPIGEFEPWLRLAVESAMRRGEIDRLTWHHVDFKERTAHLPETKNGAARTIPLSKVATELLWALRQAWEKRPEPKGDRVFTLTIQGFKSAYRRARQSAAETHPEIAKVRFHDTRREATTRMAKKFKNPLDLAKVTGHKKIEVLVEAYYKPNAADLVKQLDQDSLL